MHLEFDSHHTSTAVKWLHGPAYLAEAMSKHFSSELNRECVSWDPLPFKTHCPQVLRIRRNVHWLGIQWILRDPVDSLGSPWTPNPKVPGVDELQRVLCWLSSESSPDQHFASRCSVHDMPRATFRSPNSASASLQVAPVSNIPVGGFSPLKNMS